MSAEDTESVAVRMVFPVVGVPARAGETIAVPAEQAAALVASNTAVFADPTEPAPIYAEDLEPAAEPAADSAASAGEVNGGKTGGTRARQARPRGDAAGLDAGSGTAGPADGQGNAEPREGDIAS